MASSIELKAIKCSPGIKNLLREGAVGASNNEPEAGT